MNVSPADLVAIETQSREASKAVLSIAVPIAVLALGIGLGLSNRDKDAGEKFKWRPFLACLIVAVFLALIQLFRAGNIANG